MLEFPSATSVSVGIFLWIDLFLWLPVAGLLYKAKHNLAAVLTMVYWLICLLSASCLYHNTCPAFNYETVVDIIANMQAAWVSSVIQLLTEHVPQWEVQVVLYALTQVLASTYRKLLGNFWIAVVDVCMFLFYLPLNWWLAKGIKKIPWKQPLFYAVPIFMVLNLAWLFLIENQSLGTAVFYRGLSFALVFKIFEKANWKSMDWISSSGESGTRESQNFSGTQAPPPSPVPELAQPIANENVGLPGSD